MHTKGRDTMQRYWGTDQPEDLVFGQKLLDMKQNVLFFEKSVIVYGVADTLLPYCLRVRLKIT